MILAPWNDYVCLNVLHDQARKAASIEGVQIFARECDTLDNVIERIRSLPHRLDQGFGGPRIACGDVTQRMRIMPPDPNCFERTLWYLASCEVLDPTGRRSSATVMTDAGLHTFPVDEFVD